MEVSYQKLWHILLDRKMKKKDFMQNAGITPYAMRQLGNDDAVSTDIIAKVCRFLSCTPNEIMDIVPQNERKEEKNI